MLRLAFRHWTTATRALGLAQTRFLMLLVYVTMVIPTGLVLRLRSDPLRLKPPVNGNWMSCEQRTQDIHRARQQF